MEQFPLVSIAMCTYNGAGFLTDQLDTLVNQTYQQIEIIVVDDCSTDDTFPILTVYAAKYPQFKIYRNNENIGFTANFEKAVTLCRGSLIALCDQDDLWDHRKIELQVAALKDNILIYHDSEFIHEDGASMHKSMSGVMNLYRGSEPEVFLFFNCVSGHSILMKKELLNDALPLKKDYFHDWWLAYVAANVGKIDFIPRCLVKYRQHDSSDTNILRRKRGADSHSLSSVQKIMRIQQWLAFCAAFPKNRNPEIIEQFYNAFTQRVNSYLSFTLSRLLFKHRRTIFYIRKKSKLNRLNYIFGQVWGLKTKKLYH